MYFSNKELFYKYPGHLTWLCAAAFGKFVSSLLMNLVIQKQQHLVKEICEHLQHMLHSSLPESIADEMKIRILLEYEKTYTELSHLCSSEDDYQEVATEIFIAILHPSVTRIECLEETCHPQLLDGFKMKYSDLIYSAIPKLYNLKTLRIGDAYYLNNRYELGEAYCDSVSGTLEEFRCALSSNLEITTLYEQCKKLKILDVGDALDVYDESVPNILKMECLEELDVHYTSIFSEGLDDLLNGLVNTRHSDGKLASECLKRFVCDELSQEQVYLVSDKFPNLISLTLMYISGDCNLNPLKQLKHLKNLNVRLDSYKYLKKLLSDIGGQLVCLSMRSIDDADLNHVAYTCTSLKCLHLDNSPRVERSVIKSESHKVYPVSEFPQVVSLQLDFDDEASMQYMMPQFKNVRRLFLSNCNNDDVFNFVLQRKCMEHLEIAFFKKYKNVNIALQFFEKYAVVTDFPVKFDAHSICMYSYPI